jgi:hypothetical protein
MAERIKCISIAARLRRRNTRGNLVTNDQTRWDLPRSNGYRGAQPNQSQTSSGAPSVQGWGLRVGAYEFTDEKVLAALGAARDRGADVQVLYHAEDDAQKISNETAIQKFGLQNICQPRNAQGLTLSHNKTIVLTKAGAAQAVLTGSTNFSVGGIYGHSNVVHICERDDVAAKYLWLWNELKKNIPKSADASVLAGKTPLPGDPLAEQITPIFSPRDSLEALDWYAQQAKGANDALFMTFAFGMNLRFQDAYRNGNARLRYALMETMSGPTPDEGAATRQ